MRIQIANRWKPFSHECGATCLIPGTAFACQVFPARLCLINLSCPFNGILDDIAFDLSGPVKEFTVLQELEKGYVDIWGQAKEGYFHYRLAASAGDKKISALVLKAPPCSNLWQLAKKYPACENKRLKVPFENLSFGVTKSQDWPEVLKRGKLAEMLPFIYRLGHYTNDLPILEYQGGTAFLLSALKKYIAAKDPLKAALYFEYFLQASFMGMLVPCFEDKKYQGFNLPKHTPNVENNILSLLTTAKSLIKQMLIAIVENQVDILPCLLPELHCGRMLNCRVGPFGTLDFEWSKKQIRRMAFSPLVDCSLQFCFHKGITSYRLRANTKDRGGRVESGQKLNFICGKEYCFDNFQ